MLTSSKALAIARVGLGLATLCNSVEVYAILRHVADGQYAMPVFSWAPAPSPVAVTTYFVLAVTASIAMVAGRGVVVAATLSTLLTCTILLWDQQTYSNHLWLGLILVALLIPAHLPPRGRAEQLRGSDDPGAPPAWPLLLMKVQLSVCYAFAGLSKLNPAFLSGVPLAGWMRWELPAWLTVGAAAGTVAAELFLALGLWFSRTRRLAVLLGVGLHLSIVVLLASQTVALTAFALMCGCLYPLFFLPHPVAAAPHGPALSGLASSPTGRAT